MIFFCVFARVRACFRGYLPLNCHHDLRGNPLYLLGFLNHSRPLPIARPAPSNVRALWPQASPPSRSNVTPGPLAWVPGRTSRRRRLGRQAVAIGKPRARTSRRRRVHPGAGAVAFIVTPWPSSCRSSRRRRVHPLDGAGAVFILARSPWISGSGRRVYGHAARRVLALSRVRPVICRWHGWQSARRKKQGGLGARINTGLPVVLARRRRQWFAGFHARVPCPWGQCGVPRLLAASSLCARVNSSRPGLSAPGAA